MGQEIERGPARATRESNQRKSIKPNVAPFSTYDYYQVRGISYATHGGNWLFFYCFRTGRPEAMHLRFRIGFRGNLPSTFMLSEFLFRKKRILTFYHLSFFFSDPHSPVRIESDNFQFKNL